MSAGRTDPPGVRHASPFPGLRPFAADDAAYFFGRDREREFVVDNLRAYPISVLFGAAGSGKSSLLHAGALPSLARRSGAGQAVVCSTWTGGPVASLRAALLESLDAETATPLEHAPLATLVSAAASRAEGRLPIVLDQFEQVLAGGGSPGDELAHAIAGASPDAHVMIVVREDALGHLDRFEGLIPGLFDHLVELSPLDARAARAAIEQPVAAWGRETGDEAVVEPALVEAVVEQLRPAGRTGDDDGETRPVEAVDLQLAMATLWDAAPVVDGRRELTRTALDDLGGVQRIVARHVERALDACTPRERQIADAMLRELVTPSGAKVPHAVADLAAHAGVPEPEAAQVLARLDEARLLVPVAGARHLLRHDALAEPVLAWRARRADREARRRERRRLLGIMGFVAALLALATLVHALDPLELATVDARFALRGSQPPPRDVLLVEIDDASLARLDADWPLSRRLDGDAIDWIGEGDPKVIAYDVDFSGRQRDDVSLAEAVAGARGRVVLAASATAAGGRVNVLGGDDVLEAIGARPGYAAFDPDLGGAIRHPISEARGVDGFAVAAAETALGRPLARAGVDDAWLDYYGPEGTLRSIPFWKVIDHAVPQRLFRDKVVVVGVTSPSIDRHPVWGVHNDDMPGAEIQATAIDTLLRGLPLRSPPTPWTLVLIAACALLPPLSSRRLPLPATLAVTLGAAALYAVATAVAFEHGLVLPVVAPLAALLLAAFAVVLLAFVAQRPRGA